MDTTGRHRGRRKLGRPNRRTLQIAVFVPLAVASTCWAAYSLNTPLRTAAGDSWFPEGYTVVAGPDDDDSTTELGLQTDAGPSDDASGEGGPKGSDSKDRNRSPVNSDDNGDTSETDGSQNDRPAPGDTSDPKPRPTDSPVPSPTSTPTSAPPKPTSSPSPSPTDSPTATPTPTPTPTPSPTPTDSPSPTPSPTPTEDPDDDDGCLPLPLPLPLPCADGELLEGDVLGLDSATTSDSSTEPQAAAAVPGSALDQPATGFSVSGNTERAAAEQPKAQADAVSDAEYDPALARGYAITEWLAAYSAMYDE